MNVLIFPVTYTVSFLAAQSKCVAFVAVKPIRGSPAPRNAAIKTTPGQRQIQFEQFKTGRRFPAQVNRYIKHEALQDKNIFSAVS